MAELDGGALADLPPGTMKLLESGSQSIGLFNCHGELHAIEDRCTHDDGPLCHGTWDIESCTISCPRHGANFDLKTGRPLSLPAYLPARIFPVRVREGNITVEVG